LIVLVAGALVLLGPWGARGEDPKIAALVNGESVTLDELQRMLADPSTRGHLEQELGVQYPDSEKLERLALQKLIERRLFLQEAVRRSFTVSQEDLDQTLTALRGRFEDLRSFGIWLKERGLDDRSLFETLRTEMLAARVAAALVEGVAITEEQVRGYYEAHKQDLVIGEEVRLRIIAVESEAAAEEVLTALRKGGNFARVARKRSLGARAAQGGDTGWVDSRALPPPLRQAVGALKAGEAGGPLRKGAEEFLIIGLEGRRPAKAESLAEARPEIERRLLPAKQQEIIQAWLTEQEKKSKIEVLLQPGKPTTE
jgi:parvulin-like peptidyl-prolyl isomerase